MSESMKSIHAPVEITEEKKEQTYKALHEKTTENDSEHKGSKNEESNKDSNKDSDKDSACKDRDSSDEELFNAYKQKYARLDVEKASEVLKQYFPFPQMKREQKECLDALKKFQHVLNIMPTGGGKSLVYQIVPLLIGGVSIVISPLISLIQDQVAALNKKNIVAVSIHSSLSKRQNEQIMNRLKEESLMNIQILYGTPETATKDPLLSIIKTLYRRKKISLIAIDEAHCISTWGCQFRKSYRSLNVILSACPFVRVYACTATATKMVERDIVTNLGINTKKNEEIIAQTSEDNKEKDCLRIVRCSFNRPNLKYIMVYAQFWKEEEKRRHVYNIITDKNNEGKTGIVYCFKRETCDTISAYLRSKGAHSLSYHAGLTVTARKKAQEKWISGKATVLVATIAFGMGIDRQNVSYIIHYNLPKSIENYYQESGRAGRNGNTAFCYLFFSTDEVSKMAYIIKMGHSSSQEYKAERNDSCEKELEHLECVNKLCLTDECIRAQILRHFGEIYIPPKKQNTGNQMQRSNQMKQSDADDYCCSFCHDPAKTRNEINKCKRLLYSDMDGNESEHSYCSEDFLYDKQYESEYSEEDSENDSSRRYKSKKVLYKIPFINQNRKTKYNPPYGKNTRTFYDSDDAPKKNKSFFNPNESFLHTNWGKNKLQMGKPETAKQSSFTKSKWKINENSSSARGIEATQFKSASTIIPVNIHDKGTGEVTRQVENKNKQNEILKKHTKTFDRPDLHPIKKIKKLQTGGRFVAPRNIHDVN